MADNMATLIHDINKLDCYSKSKMEELKRLRDITLFYDKLYPELRIAGQNSADTEDEAKIDFSMENAPTDECKNPDECTTADDKKNNIDD